MESNRHGVDNDGNWDRDIPGDRMDIDMQFEIGSGDGNSEQVRMHRHNLG